MTQVNDILLIEDDACLARALVRNLSARGMSVRHVSSASLARGLTERFAVGVFDIDLPDGDGVELAEELLSRRVVARALFHTGCSDRSRLARARGIGPVLAKASGGELMARVLDLRAPGLRASGVPAPPEDHSAVAS